MANIWKSTFQERINILYQNAKDNDYKLTQENYALRLGTTRSALRGWLSGQGQPDADGFARIAEIENVTVDWLVGKSDIKNSNITIAAHRTDSPTDDLPQEAIDRIEEFKELMRLKYKKK